MANFVKLLLSVGLPKAPVIGIPLVLVAILGDVRTSWKILKIRSVFVYYSLVTAFFTFCSIWAAWNGGSASDYVFIVSMFVKFVLAPYVGFYIAKAAYSSSLNWFLVFQLCLLVLAVEYSAVHKVLLLFQTNGAAEVFGSIQDKRSLGFGLLHNEGAMFVAVLFYLMISKRSFPIRFFALGWISFLLMSRLTGVLLVLTVSFVRPLLGMIVSLIIVGGVVLFHDSLSDILRQALEPVVNLLENGSFHFANYQHMLGMIVFPDNWKTWMVGDGLFFSPSGFFYRATDLGYFRSLFFGGLFFLCIFIFLHLHCVIRIGLLRPDVLLFIALFLVGMAKGLNPHPWMFFVLYFMDRLPEDGRKPTLLAKG